MVDVTPNRPIAIGNLMCSVVIDSTDQDGEAVVYTYAWYGDADLEPYLIPQLSGASSGLLLLVAS